MTSTSVVMALGDTVLNAARMEKGKQHFPDWHGARFTQDNGPLDGLFKVVHREDCLLDFPAISVHGFRMA